MIDPFTQPIFVRGKIIKIEDNVITIIFQESSVIFDESDIGDIGGNLKLITSEKYENISVGDIVIANGRMIPTNGNNGKRGELQEITEIIPNQYQPLGIDWKYTFLFLALLFILGIFFIFKRAIKDHKRNNK